MLNMQHNLTAHAVVHPSHKNFEVNVKSVNFASMKRKIDTPMKSFLACIAIALIAMICAVSGYAQGGGNKSVGLRGGYNTYNESAVAGIYFQYRFTNHFRLSADFDYLFRHHNTDAFTIDLNAHVPFAVGSRISLYPLAGLSYATWSHHMPSASGNEPQLMADTDGSTGGTSRINRFGLNLGAGAELRVNNTLKLFLEGKYNLVKSYESGMFCVGIGYVF